MLTSASEPNNHGNPHTSVAEMRASARIRQLAPMSVTIL
jgi:hypothetical protein